jgi:pimeloyl-ACP methyl ester carboxylesterase
VIKGVGADGVRHIAGYPPLPPALDAERTEMATAKAGRVSLYRAGIEDAPPLLLVHSINAAASAYEMKPLFERYRTTRSVFAPDLPGYGFSERSDRAYTPRLMTDAIHAVVDEIAARHGDAPIDAAALSLSCEFLARAAAERPERFRSLSLISPTGMDSSGPREGEPGSTRGKAPVYGLVNFPLWRQGVFDLLNTRRSQRYFLERTFGSKNIDEGLLAYDQLSANQPGGRYAPFYFLSGYLFSDDVTRLARRLPGLQPGEGLSDPAELEPRCL